MSTVWSWLTGSSTSATDDIKTNPVTPPIIAQTPTLVIPTDVKSQETIPTIAAIHTETAGTRPKPMQFDISVGSLTNVKKRLR